MKKFHTIKYHLIEQCNYQCKYCFAKFNAKRLLSLEEKLQVVDCICEYFHQEKIANGRINFAGGEPLLDGDLSSLVDRANQNGIRVSIITNASLLTKSRIESWGGKVSCVGLSVDSRLEENNRKIGRCDRQGRVLLEESLLAIVKELQARDIKIKLNIVASRLNYEEDFTGLLKQIAPDRLKILQMSCVKGVNDQAKPYQLSSAQFQEFCKRHGDCTREKPVFEDCESMKNSYLMVAPNGELVLNDCGEYKSYGSCLEEPFLELLKKCPVNKDKFDFRYKN